MGFFKYIFIIALCILVIGCTQIEIIEEDTYPLSIDVDGAYTHELTGIVFPYQVGSFYRSDVSLFEPKGENTCCSYKTPYLSPSTTITVYVYPAEHLDSDGDQAEIMSQLQDHADDISDELSDYYDSFKILSESPTVLKHDERSHSGIYVRYQYKQDIGLGLRDYISYLYLFHADDFFVKYRATFPIDELDETDQQINNFMDELKW